MLSYGFWATFGVKDRLSNDAGIQAAKELLHQARMAGVNLFDNAEVYGNPGGEAERIMGGQWRNLWRNTQLNGDGQTSLSLQKFLGRQRSQ